MGSDMGMAMMKENKQEYRARKDAELVMVILERSLWVTSEIFISTKYGGLKCRSVNKERFVNEPR